VKQLKHSVIVTLMIVKCCISNKNKKFDNDHSIKNTTHVLYLTTSKNENMDKIAFDYIIWKVIHFILLNN
jgi:hypothetical protein